MKRFILYATLLLFFSIFLLFVVYIAIGATVPTYKNSVGNLNHIEKITGMYLLKQSAAQGDNLIIYGSSELRTTEISTHPSNFFAGNRSGFQVNLVGRGSCQSLIHAISIAATGDSLTGQKVVLITSPQSYVEDGIAADLFMANFSKQQYLELLQANDVSTEVKAYLSARVLELLEQYETETDSTPDLPIRYLAESYANPTPVYSLRRVLLMPYYAFSRYLYDLDDKTSARSLLKSVDKITLFPSPDKIDWPEESATALAEAERMTENNDFGMLDDYYTTYIGTRISRQEGKDRGLYYSVSREYDDLRILLETCRQKGIEPLFVHVPLHGQWSDYTGFPAERRNDYYNNVRDIVTEYGVEMLDLTAHEYNKYFLCDVMHLGWKGWLEVDKALIEYYYER